MPESAHSSNPGSPASTVPAAPAQAEPRRRWRTRFAQVFLILLAAVLATLALWTWVALRWSYSEGARAGYVQKFDRQGWVCKTWEGELAMVNLPGAAPEVFPFTVRDEAVARRITAAMGQRVTLTYEQHVAAPSSCFGETESVVRDVRIIGP